MIAMPFATRPSTNLYPILLGLLVLLMSVASQAFVDSKLSSIFQGEMLNAQVAYLETITGPAMHIYPGHDGVQLRDYRVEGCRVVAYAKGTEVVGYSLDLNPKCNFNLHGFMGDGYSTTDGLTIAKFVRGGFGADMHVQSNCIYLCGNAADPTVDFTFEGPHVLNFLSIVLTVTLADTPSLDAEERWEKAMRSREGDDYIRNVRFNCTNKYDTLAIQAFANAPVNQITIGYQPNATFYKRSCAR
jgi:hypothetical protein